MDHCARLSALDKHFSSIPIRHTPPKPVKALLRSIIDFQPVLHRPDKQVAFFGVFNAGKSTLLNAILGARLLPTNVNRATGVITKIGYASQPIANVVRVTSNDLLKEPIDFDHIAKYILLNLSSITSKAPEGIEVVSIGIPLLLLTKDIVLVDTPGLLDNPVLTERTYREVERSDLAVMVLPADKLLSQVEKDAAKQVHEQLNGNIVFVINRLELVDQNERAEILDWAKTGLSGLGNSLVGQPNIFAIEAKKALASRQSNIHSKADSKQPFTFK
jgi:predicted GTPase